MKHEIAKLIDTLKEAQELVIYVEGRDYNSNEKVDDVYHNYKMYQKYGKRRLELLEEAISMIRSAFNEFELFVGNDVILNTFEEE